MSDSRRFSIWIGAGICVVATVYFVLRLVDTQNDIPWADVLNQSAASFAGATTMYVLAICAGGFGWHFLLTIGEARVTPALSMGVYLVSQFGKYIPGNVAHHIGRVVLANSAGVPTTKTILSMIAELAIGVAAATLLAAIAATAHLNLLKSSSAWHFVSTNAAWVVPVAVALLAGAGAYAWHRLTTTTGMFPTGLLVLTRTRLLAVSGVFLLYLLSFVCFGLAFTALISGSTHEQSSTPSGLLIGIAATAWLAGLLTPGAPAGIGVREATIVILASESLGEPLAIAASVMFRAISIVGDAVCLLLGLILSRAVRLGSTES